MRPDLIKEFLQDDGVESGAVICLEEACKGVGGIQGAGRGREELERRHCLLTDWSRSTVGP